MSELSPPALNHFEREVIKVMRKMDADEQRTALRMMRRYVELLPEMSIPDDDVLDRSLEDDE